MRGAFVAFEVSSGKMQVHVGIRSFSLGEINLGFGFDDEEGVGVGAAGGAEFLAGFVEGVGLDGEDNFALGAADEIEAAFLLDELEMR